MCQMGIGNDKWGMAEAESKITNRKSKIENPFALRQLLKNPGLTAVAALTPALDPAMPGNADERLATSSERRENKRLAIVESSRFTAVAVLTLAGRQWLPLEIRFSACASSRIGATTSTLHFT